MTQALSDLRRWLSVHVRDMSTLQENHPSVYQKFESGAFVVNKN